MPTVATRAEGSTMNASVEVWAIRYIEKYQFALVPIPPGHKAPLHQGWNQQGGYITDPREAGQQWSRAPRHGETAR